jgi:hypothetical protein
VIKNFGLRLSDLGFEISTFKPQISDLRFQIPGCIFLGLILMAGSPTFAAAPPPSTDDQLRNNLEAKAGDDYDRELLGDPDKPGGKGRVDDALQKKLQQELGAAAKREEGPKDPLEKVAEGMHAVVPRLGQHDSGKETQYLQRLIVSDLNQLIEQAKKSGSQSGSKTSGSKLKGKGGTKPEQKPESASTNSTTPADRSDPRIRESKKLLAEELAKARGRMIDLFHPDLPSREREQVIEEAGEYFLPEYKLEIEDYFRRLSQDQPESERP